MRQRRFILPQAGTGGYGIRPYVFCGDGEGHVFPCCVCRGDHWSPVNLPPQRIFRDSFLVRQAGTGGYGIRSYVFEAAEHSASTNKSAGRAASPVCGIRNVGAVVCAGGVAGGVSSAGVCALTGAGIVLACSGVNRPLSSSCGTKGESKGKGSEFFHG